MALVDAGAGCRGSDVAWDAGIAAPLDPETLEGDRGPPPEVVELGKKAHAAAAAGKDASDGAARAKVYADLTTTSAACPSALGVGGERLGGASRSARRRSYAPRDRPRLRDHDS